MIKFEKVSVFIVMFCAINLFFVVNVGVLEPKPMFGLSELEFELIMWYFDIPLPPPVPWLYNANILSFDTSTHVCPV